MRKADPAKLLIVSFLAAILIGSLLLYLPFSTHKPISYIDALFTSTSAVCVTGLIVKDTGKDFTTFGQIVILILIQLGGLGIMTFSSVILLLLGRGLSFVNRSVLEQSFVPTAFRNFSDFLKKILLYTFITEVVGALLLFLRFSKEFKLPFAIFTSIFHSISAFCNAGFSLFTTSLMKWKGDLLINIVMMSLIVLGGIGFFVFWDIRERILGHTRTLKLHSKIVITFTAFLIITGSLLLLSIEWNKAFAGFTVKEKILSALFQAVTPRTAGFNTVDIASLSLPSLVLLIMLMYTGASPGSTGGGIKTSTLFLIALSVKQALSKRDQVQIYGRAVEDNIVNRAFFLALVFLSFHFFGTFFLALTEHFNFLEIAFEEMSALGTVGLSLGITPKLSTLGKIIIIVSMFAGRVGPLTLLAAVSRKGKGRFALPHERVMIG